MGERVDIASLAGLSVDEVRKALTLPLTGEEQGSDILRRMIEPYREHGVLPSSAGAVLGAVREQWAAERLIRNGKAIVDAKAGESGTQ